MLTSDREVVAELGQAIAQRIGQPRFQLWFLHKTRFHWQEDMLLVGVPNRFYQEWLQKAFGSAVVEAASVVLGQPMQVRFVIDPELFQAARQAQEEVPPPPTPLLPPSKGEGRGGAGPGATPPKPASAAESSSTAGATRRSHLRTRRWHRLEEFVVGACNRVAFASALSVIEQPGQDANPLVLHGPVGTGKTHLLEGIYSGLRQAYPDWEVRFVTAEEFTNRFLPAMRLSKMSAFRKYFRECDALLVDDLHFLASKKVTQEEFLHTFDALQAEGRQVVVTCDCHPRLNEQFLPELTDRLLGGAVWGLLPPDQDTRLNLLRARVLRGGLPPFPDQVLVFLAGQLRGNVRELEGALNSIAHYSRVAGKKIDQALAREALGDLLRHSVAVVHLADVDRAICSVLRLEKGALQSRQRSWAYSHPRMLAIFLARKHTSATYLEIGRYFGNRSHSTAVAAEKKVRHWLQEDNILSLGQRKVRVRDVIDRAERELLG